MNGFILRKTQDMLCFCLIVLLGEISGGETLSFSGLPGTGNVTENSSPGTVVYTFSVNLSPNLLPNVSVQAGFPKIINSNPLTKAFAINSESTVLYKVVTTGNPVPDYETMPHRFELQILVYDTAGAYDLQILTVQVLDEPEPPVFLGNLANQTVTIYILENRASGPIYQMHVAGSVNYSLTLTPESLSFSVSTTGTISSLKVFDYEKDPHSYLFNITATNHFGQSTTRTVIINIININDESPYFTMKERAFKILEESPPRYVVANITAKDPDGEDFSRLRFSISNPAGIPYFSIDPDTGVLTVARRIDRDTNPFREHPNITLVVRVDESPSSERHSLTELVITIEDINDNPPGCEKYNYRVEFKETNISSGAIILDLKDSCHEELDFDAELPNKQLNFTGLSGVGSDKFTQDPPGSGRIKLIGNVDLENETGGAGQEKYTLTIVVENIAPPYSANIIYIYIKIEPVNEFQPVFSSPSYVFNVLETTAVQSRIGQVIATDKDVPPTGISYSISAENCTSRFGLPEMFWINPIGGNVEIVAKLDYETSPSCYLTVQASDNDGKTTIVSVTVNVLEANDEPPICLPNSYLLRIPVDLTYGTNIDGFSIVCTDRDSSPRTFRYFIDSGNVNNHFTFSPSAGSSVSRLTLASPFDYESGLDIISDYKLKVFITDDNLLSAADRGTYLTQTGTVTLTIKVIPNPTTVVPTTPGVTLVTSRENVYSASAWYVPFIISIGSLLLLGLLGYLTFLLARYIHTHCPPKPKAEKLKADKKPLIKMPEKKKAKKEVVWEMTDINTVFDGEATDPVTGKLYEYNSKSGARRWKDTNVPSKLEEKDPVAPVMTTTNSSQRNVSPKEAETSSPKPMAQKPSEMTNETLAQNSKLKLEKPKEELLGKGSSSPIPPHRSPASSPKIYPKYENQSLQK
ncbi:cadherin-related family member 3 [Rhineura floridana]|uniref:cadherin-related family member 3 n=1 Tax=Rhineura floridana TaxID=261503 RepID=UPI002AC89209|nr:cadherin-related family member 3 [Rhineura floridana]